MRFQAPCQIAPAACLACTLLLPTAVFAGDRNGDSKWDVQVGAGVMVGPKYEGSDETEVTPIPLLSIEWDDRIFLNPGDGLGVHIYNGENARLSTSIGYDGGRDEGDSSDLRGLGDVDGAAVAKLNFEYEFGPVTPYVSVSKHIGGSDGLEAQIGIQSMLPLGRPPLSETDTRRIPFLTFGVSADWADEEYMSSYFGVTALQSGRSGLQQFSASSGFKSANAEIGIMYPILDSWSVNGRVGYSQLLGDAADSPISKEDGQVSGGVFVAYQF